MCEANTGCLGADSQSSDGGENVLILISGPERLDVKRTGKFIIDFLKDSRPGKKGEDVAVLDLATPYEWYTGENWDLQKLFQRFQTTYVSLPDGPLMNAVFEEGTDLYKDSDILCVVGKPLSIIQCEMLSNWARKKGFALPGIICIELNDGEEEQEAGGEQVTKDTYHLLEAFVIKSKDEAQMRQDLITLIITMIQNVNESQTEF